MRIYSGLIILLLVSARGAKDAEDGSTMDIGPYCSLVFFLGIECVDFKYLSDLDDLSWYLSSIDRMYFMNAYMVILKPVGPIPFYFLDGSWTDAFSRISNGGFFNFEDNTQMAIMHEFVGFDINIQYETSDWWSCFPNSAPCNFTSTAIAETFKDRYAEFRDYGLNFFYNGSKIWPVDVLPCNESLLLRYYSNQSKNVFSFFPFLTLSRLKHSSSENVCPFIFINAQISDLTLAGGPLISFDTTDYSNLDELNSNIPYLTLKYMYKIDLTSKTLHADVFKQMAHLNLDASSINSIDKDVFVDLDSLKDIYIGINNFKYLVHVNQMDWLNSLNNQVHINLDYLAHISNDFLIDYIDETNARISINSYTSQDFYPKRMYPYLGYDFPDQDFCLFVNYPHSQLVVTGIFGVFTADMCNSCTLQWIYKYVPVYLNHLNISSMRNKFLKPNGSVPTCSILWKSEVNHSSCDFDLLLDNCKLNTTTATEYRAEYFSPLEAKTYINSILSTLQTTVGLIISGISLASNLIIVITCLYGNYVTRTTNKTAHQGLVNLKHLINKYLCLGAVLNCIYSLFYLFEFCLACSSRTLFYLEHEELTMNCFYQSLVLTIVYNMTKMISNFCIIQFSLNRYALVSNDDKDRLTKLSKMSFQKFLLFSFLSSSLLTVVIYFQFVLFSNSYDGFQTNPSSDYNFYWFSQAVDGKLAQSAVITLFTTIHDLISYVFFCGFTIYIDCKTVKVFKSVLKQKQNISSIDRSDEMQASIRKNTAMVLINSLMNLILRLPDLTPTVMLFIVLFNSRGAYLVKTFCLGYNLCVSVIQSGSVFYMLSLSTNIFVQIFFNNVFRLSFNRLLSTIFCRKLNTPVAYTQS